MNRQCKLLERRREPLLPPYATWAWSITKAGERVKRRLVVIAAHYTNKGKTYPYNSAKRGWPSLHVG